MSSERPTVRPVTLGRLAEITHVCEEIAQPTDFIERKLGVTHRRARETILEAVRIGLLKEADSETEGSSDDAGQYLATTIGDEFLAEIRNEHWVAVNSLLETHSPHYSAFLKVLKEIEPATLEELLRCVEETEKDSSHDYNQTGIELVGDWGERLGTVQRNAFTGVYYSIQQAAVPANFSDILLSVFDDIEETAGMNMRQRYLSIPELREHACQRIQCPRGVFDDALVELVGENVGKLELSGAPVDTGAKDARYGIKSISRDDGEGLVSTSQSTEQVMAGVEQFDKQYYYLAVHDRDLSNTKEATQ